METNFNIRVYFNKFKPFDVSLRGSRPSAEMVYIELGTNLIIIIEGLDQARMFVNKLDSDLMRLESSEE